MPSSWIPKVQWWIMGSQGFPVSSGYGKIEGAKSQRLITGIKVSMVIKMDNPGYTIISIVSSVEILHVS